ncbi:hypothetical protein A2V71_01520 [Candidatus Berkelbacteria bacterium RBG_13_40_8]|uniref:Uncharacterized protein n=1 Tax=Candidatus Berkelbacteria bacterium RBG_13_40_8 TaxID=1797467 RepID=A0A1F5DNT3_9BACT|nr:MAG: hypothetical protein A2V71_01520 [Candidatus Berkelbacteria bacterium RBG_13_40_8]
MAQQDKQFETIIKKLNDFDKSFDKVDKRFDKNDERFVKNDRKMDILIKKSLFVDDRFFTVSQEIKKSKDEILTVFDKVMVIIQRLDQERVFTFAAVKRLQEQQESQQKEIIKIKQVLNIK